jgi:hypothetical protein
MMLFAFFLIIIGLGFLIFGNYSFASIEKKTSLPPNTPSSPEKHVLNRFKNFGKDRKSKITKEIKKRIFNKKYPEKLIEQEDEIRILKEREFNYSHATTLNEIEENSLEKQINYTQNEKKPNPLPIIEDTTSIHYEERKIPIFITGNLYVDFSKEIPLGDRNIKSMDWKEVDFQHFRRMGNTKLYENNGNIEIKNENVMYRIVINEIEKIIFYENSVCILPNNNDSPNLLFFSGDINLLKVRLTEELRVL